MEEHQKLTEARTMCFGPRSERCFSPGLFSLKVHAFPFPSASPCQVTPPPPSIPHCPVRFFHLCPHDASLVTSALPMTALCAKTLPPPSALWPFLFNSYPSRPSDPLCLSTLPAGRPDLTVSDGENAAN